MFLQQCEQEKEKVVFLGTKRRSRKSLGLEAKKGQKKKRYIRIAMHCDLDAGRRERVKRVKDLIIHHVGSFEMKDQKRKENRKFCILQVDSRTNEIGKNETSVVVCRYPSLVTIL